MNAGDLQILTGKKKKDLSYTRNEFGLNKVIPVMSSDLPKSSMRQRTRCRVNLGQ